MPKQHNAKEVRKLFKNLKAKGFVVVKKPSGSYRIDPPPNLRNKESYYTHGTLSCLHQIRRDFKRLYDVDVNA